MIFRYILSFSILFIALGQVLAQNLYSLSGKVLDSNGNKMFSATIFLHEIKRGTVTNWEGKYEINNLNEGKYKLEVSYVGFETFVTDIVLNENMDYDIILTASQTNLNEVVIVTDYIEKKKQHTSLNIEIVNDDFLRQNMGGSLMKSLERIPGVSTIDIGSGQSKPVIRGIGFNRVVVVENGIKHEAQQWGTDHGLEIDQFAVDYIEVIKGPASLSFGADAIGGVIDMKQSYIPYQNTLSGNINLFAKSNNSLIGTSVFAAYRKQKIFFNIRSTLMEYSDFRVPTDSVDIYSYKIALQNNSVRNTAGNEQNFHFSIGIVDKKYSSRFYISSINSKSGFFANAHGLEPRGIDYEQHDKSTRDILFPYQDVSHTKMSNKTYLTYNDWNMETNIGFQHNFRQEWSEYVNHGYMPVDFSPNLNYDKQLERLFEKFIYSGNIKVINHLTENIELTIGSSADFQDNRISGRGFIIPEFTYFGIGSFSLFKYKLSPISIFQLGVRYDYGIINTESYYDWFESPDDFYDVWTAKQRASEITKSWHNATWSIGYNYNLEKINAKINAGKSFRIPTAQELAANGINYHQFSYEVGNTDLLAEIAYQFDMGFEYSQDNYAIGVSPFANYFTNYIYLNPSWEHDRVYGNGNQIFYYSQTQVLRMGGELHSHYNPIPQLQLGIIGEYVYSEQTTGEKKGYTLPFSPPTTLLGNIKLQAQTLWQFQEPYLSGDYKMAFNQTKIVPPEEITEGYSTINIRFGAKFKFKKQFIDINMQIQNLLNVKYFNHTSYYRLINMPEPGRNYVVNISLPFLQNISKN